MAIVVLCRKLSPIDLTASLLLAFYRKNSGIYEEIEWIAEDNNDNELISCLDGYAAKLKNEFKIKVLRKNEISVLNPTNKQLCIFWTIY